MRQGHRQRAAHPEGLVRVVQEVGQSRHRLHVEGDQCRPGVVLDPPVLQQRNQGRHVEGVVAVACHPAPHRADRLAHDVRGGVVEEPNEVLLVDRLPHRADRLGPLPAHLRALVREQVLEHLAGAPRHLLVPVVGEACHRRRPHSRVGFLEARQHQLADVLSLQVRQHLDRLGANIGVVVSQPPLDQGGGVDAARLGQDLEGAAADLGVVVVEEQGRHQIAAALGGDQLQAVQHLAPVGAGQRLH